MLWLMSYVALTLYEIEGFSYVYQMNNNSMTNIVMSSSINMNKKTPDQ